jgi:hypothetical protein
VTDSGGMIYIPSLMKIGAVIQAILRFCSSNLKGCNVRIMKCAAEMGSSVMIYVPIFMIIG